MIAFETVLAVRRHPARGSPSCCQPEDMVSGTRARPRVASETNSRGVLAVESAPDDRRILAADNLRAYIQRVVAAAPPLTQDQRDRLASLLNGDQAKAVRT